MKAEKTIASIYLNDIQRQFKRLKSDGERAVAQLKEADLFRTIDSESNSIGILMKHLAGNMRSRWRDFLNSDGEKPDRFRDQEFEILGKDTREGLMEQWESGWSLFFDTLNSLKEEDLTKTVLIRSEPHFVIQAINRQLAHYGFHIGQIVYLAKHYQEKEWQTLSVPKGKSDEFTKEMQQKHQK